MRFIYIIRLIVQCCVFTNFHVNMDRQFTKFAVVLGLSYLTLQLAGQPTECTDKTQCSIGSYCDLNGHFCTKCISCKELKREPPRDLCAESVLNCGPCTEGLVEDLRLDRACVQPSERSEGDRVLPVYAWFFIALLLLVFCAIAAYVVCKKDTLFSNIFNIRASTHASVRCPPSNGNGAVSIPSAPAQPQPPPYNSIYTPERPNSPDDSQSYSNGHVEVEEDSARPFIKRSSPEAARGPREAAVRQAALPYSSPTYVRGPEPGFGLPSLGHGGNTDAVIEVFQHHDEDTMESAWTPDEPINYYDVTSPSVPAAPDASAVVPAPAPAIAPATRNAHAKPDHEDSNDNRGRDAAPDGAHGNAAPPLGVHITVVNNYNHMEQRNNVNLPKH